MTLLVRRPSPYDELFSLRQAVDRLFDNDFTRPFVRPPGNGRALGFMPLDVRTDAESLTIEASLPGISPDDVEISVEGRTVTLSSTSRAERTAEEGSYLVREIRRGSVSRSIALPEGLEVDKASATFENGLLRLRIPRAEQVKPQRIKISPVSDGRPVPATEAAADTTATAPAEG